MGDNTGIEWTDATWNPVTGCEKVSQGCKHCYAERDWVRLQHLPAYAGREFTDVRTHADRLDQPLRWKKPRRIFVNSMSDLFHPDIHDDFIGMCFRTMARAPQHTFQVLTKRAERMRSLLTHPKMRGYVERVTPQWPLPNVWLGVSVEDQAAADERIPMLLQTPAAVRWISAEPLLGPVSLRLERLGHWNALAIKSNQPWATTRLHWVVVGGESGPKARPMHPAWARSLRDQCAAAGVPFLFKQWGEWAPDAAHGIAFEGRCCIWGGDYDNAVERVGKKLAGRLLDGVLHDGYPVASVICFDGMGRA